MFLAAPFLLAIIFFIDSKLLCIITANLTDQPAAYEGYDRLSGNVSEQLSTYHTFKYYPVKSSSK